MQRVLTTATLVGLLIATAAAFAITERLKLEKSPISGTLVTPKAFSPVCGCARARATVRVRLRRSDLVSVTILGAHKAPVRALVNREQLPRGANVFHWDGRTDFGTRAPDGTYHAEIHLANQHQTIVLPNPITIDTSRPAVTAVTTNRDTFSPDGDGQSDFVRLHYELSKDAHAVLYLDGSRIVGPTRLHRPKGDLTWDGKVGGQTLGPGTYRLELGAVDLAGNSTKLADRYFVDVQIRFIQLASHRLTGVRRGKRFSIGVSTDATRYAWTLGGRSGFATGPVLTLRASQRGGLYTLTVREHGHIDRAAVIVR